VESDAITMKIISMFFYSEAFWIASMPNPYSLPRFEGNDKQNRNYNAFALRCKPTLIDSYIPVMIS
jgi:hypothetical protein